MDKNTLQKDILGELGLNDLPEEKKIHLLAMMTESLLKTITVRVLEELSEEERDEFAKLREEGDFDKVSAFLKDKITDYDKMIEEVIVEFKAEMKETVGDLKKALDVE